MNSSVGGTQYALPLLLFAAGDPVPLNARNNEAELNGPGAEGDGR